MALSKPDLSAALAEQVLDAIDVGLAVFDRRDRVRYCNQAFARIWGLPGEGLTGSSIDRIATAIEGRAVGGPLEEFQAHLDNPGLVADLDIELEGEHFIELSAQPLKRRDRLRGRVWRCRDLTLQKRSELAMLHAEKLESLGVLAGGIAHDFNNLLASILGHSELGLAEIESESPAGDSFRAIGKAAERASDLTQQLLAYAGKGTVLVEPVDLSTLVAEVVDLMRVSIAEEVSLNLDLNDDLPPIIADATQVRQVAMNLVLNASEAITERGEITITTGTRHLSAEEIAQSLHHQETAPGEFVFVQVTDDGGGMDEDTLARIFDPFFSTKFTGRGLGLAGVLGIVRGHRGLLQVQSRPRSGTTFAVHLPRTNTTESP
jgi:signal transduction histidine kinase